MPRKENIATFKMPRLPSPDGEQRTVNRTLIDTVKSVWIQVRSLRSDLNKSNQDIEQLKAKVRFLKENM